MKFQTLSTRFLSVHWPLVLILILGGVIRLQGLLDACANWDELNVLALAQLPIPDIFRVLAIRDIHPAGFHLLLHYWIQLAGNSDAAMRYFAWLMGLLGLGATYLLAWELSKSRTLAGLAALLNIGAPLLFRYGQLATPYGAYDALVLLSWYCLLKILPSPDIPAPDALASDTQSLDMQTSNPQPLESASCPRTIGYYAGYGVTAGLACHMHALGLLSLVSQGCYLLYLSCLSHSQTWMSRTTPPNPASAPNAPTLQRPIVITGLLIGLLGVSLVPFYWNVLQVGHVSYASEIVMIHQIDPILERLAPANFLWMGYEHVFDSNPLPPLSLLLLYGLLTYIIVGVACVQLYRQARATLRILLAMAVPPFLLSLILPLLTGLPVFQFRILLFCLFPLSFLVAYWLRQTYAQAGKRQRILSVGAGICFLTLQAYFTVMFHRIPDDPWCQYAAAVKKTYHPGDGLIVYPGWSLLGFVRYFQPAQFGLTPLELATGQEQKRQNIFHMVQQIDNTYFAVSGDDLLRQPESEARLRFFVSKHPKVLVIGFSPKLLPSINCQPHVLVLNQQFQFEPVVCLNDADLQQALTEN